MRDSTSGAMINLLDYFNNKLSKIKTPQLFKRKILKQKLCISVSILVNTYNLLLCGDEFSNHSLDITNTI